MTRPVFNQEIIGELRKRVAAHNEIVATTHPDMAVKLGGVKKLYKRWYSGADPHAHALAMLDGRLLSMQTAALGGLEKARRPFDQGRHPRGRRGEFRPSGGGRGGGGGGGGSVAPIGGAGDDGDDALLQAAQTQVIPETRYSVFGPPIGAGIGMGYGAISGASANLDLPWRGGGSLGDRVTTATTGMVGHALGRITGQAVRSIGIEAPRDIARVTIPAINRTLGTNIPRPGPTAGRAFGHRLADAVARGGRKTGRFGGHVMSLATIPAAASRQFMTHYHGPIAGRIAGGLVGAAFPGLLTAGSLHHLMTRTGPYLDTMRPRRVKKLVGPLWDAPEVLAKQAELLANPNLAKAADLSEELAKAVGGAAMARALRFLRGPVTRAYRAPTPPTFGPPPPIGHAAAARAFREAAPHFTVGRHVAGRALYVGAHVAGLSAAGAGIGGLTGAGLAAFAQEHPRDPRTGQFRTTGQAALTGAKHGAVIGAGLGLAAGLVGARRGHIEKLRQAVRRVRGEEGVQREGAADLDVRAHMRERAAAVARTAFANAFHADNIGRLKFKAAPGADVPPEQIEKKLGDAAVARWLKREGTAMRAGAKTWYRQQLDKAFDAHVKSELAKLSLDVKDLPRKNRLPGLLDSVDESQLQPGSNQAKIWQGAKQAHENATADIESVFSERKANIKEIGNEITALQAEHRKLNDDLSRVPTAWGNLQDANPSIAQLREFALTRLDHTPVAKTREKLIKEIDDHLPKWVTATRARADQINDEIPRSHAAHLDAQQSEHDSFTKTEAERVRNPFTQTGTGEKGFFTPRREGIDTDAGFATIKQEHYDKGVKEFRAGLEATTAAAREHLDHLADVEEAALRERIPQHGVFMGFLAQHKPDLTGRWKQAADDFSDIASGHRATLKGEMRDFYDFLHQNTRPAEAWATTKKWSKAAFDFWNSTPGKWLKENYGKIITVGGLASAIGIVETNPPKGKKWLTLDPRKWHAPRDINLVYERPNPIRRPDEAVFGLKYRDRDGQEKFLTGQYIKGKNGSESQDIPWGSNVNTVLNQVRGGGGDQRDKPKAAEVNNPGQVDQGIKRAKERGEINDQAGPEGFEFGMKSGAPGGQEEGELRTWFHSKYVRRLQGFPGSLRDHDQFYEALRNLFDADRTEAMSLTTKAHMLVGSGSARNQRGLFGENPVGDNPGGHAVYMSGNKDGITAALIRQQNAPGARMQDANDYIQMHRAMWVAAEHFNLSSQQRAKVFSELDKGYRRDVKQDPPRSKADTGAAETTGSVDEHIDRIMHEWPARDRREVNTEWEDPTNFRTELRATYDGLLSDYRTEHPNESLEQQRSAAIVGMHAYVDQARANKAEVGGDLYKLFGLTKLNPFDEQRHPRGRGGLWRSSGHNAAPAIGAISGARASHATPPEPGPANEGDFASYAPPARGRRPPDAPGAAPTEPNQFHQAIRPQHVLGQLGTYGLSQVGWDAVGNIASHFMPSGGMVANATKFGLKTLGSFGGSVGGLKGGQALGQAVGDRAPMPETPEGEGVARGLGGGAGQIAFNEFAIPATRRLISAGTARVIGAAAGTALDPFIGPAGTILGSALAGALTDEGAGVLYRHLSRYGQHVPQHALKHFGHHGPSA